MDNFIHDLVPSWTDVHQCLQDLEQEVRCHLD